MDSFGNIAQGIGQIATGAAPILGTGAQLYGQQNAAEAVEKANNAAIGTQQSTLGNISSLYSPYTTAGADATAALARAEGLNGAAPDYSGFENMPGYKFAIQQGTQAIQRQAAASGSAYTPNTGAAIGQYVTGTAMQDYNTYIQQLQAMSAQGASATGQLGNINYNTGANISQIQANTGQSQAGMYTGMGQTVGGALGGYAPGYGGYGGYGAPGASGVGSVVSGIGNIAKGVGSIFGGGGNPGIAPGSWNGPGSTYSGYTPSGYASGMDPNNPYANGSDPTGTLYVPGAGQGGNADYINNWNTPMPPSDPGLVDNTDYSGYDGGFS